MRFCVYVCTFNEVRTSYSLYKLILAGKALHQVACLEILGGLSGGIHRQVSCWNTWVSKFLLESEGDRLHMWTHRN